MRSLARPDDIERAVLAETGEVPGLEPAISALYAVGELPVAVIAQHHGGAAHLQHTDFAGGKGASLGIHDACLNAGQERARGIVLAW